MLEICQSSSEIKQLRDAMVKESLFATHFSSSRHSRSPMCQFSAETAHELARIFFLRSRSGLWLLW
jgi:hypothetical protein